MGKNKYVGIVRYKIGDMDIISASFKYFFGDLQDDYFIGQYLEIDKYKEAVALHGELKYDECFGYVPLLGLVINGREYHI